MPRRIGNTNRQQESLWWWKRILFHLNNSTTAAEELVLMGLHSSKRTPLGAAQEILRIRAAAAYRVEERGLLGERVRGNSQPDIDLT